MSKKITFRGLIASGLEEKLHMAKLNGKTGYKINKFSIISADPTSESCELVCKVYNRTKTNNVGTGIDFTDGDLMAVAYFENSSGISSASVNPTIIFDGEVTNQDMYITATDGSGNTISTNYFLELETVSLSDIQATQLTLKNLRTIASR